MYESHALQLAAYAHAEVYVNGDGEVRAWLPPERCAVVHLTPDSAELVPVDGGLLSYVVYRHAAVVGKFRRDVKANQDAMSKDPEVKPWPVGRAIDPPRVA